MSGLWPIPLSFDEAIAARPETYPIIVAALQDTGVGESDPHEPYLIWSDTREPVAKAQRLAFDAVGVAYEMVDEDVYLAAITARMASHGYPCGAAVPERLLP